MGESESEGRGRGERKVAGYRCDVTWDVAAPHLHPSAPPSPQRPTFTSGAGSLYSRSSSRAKRGYHVTRHRLASPLRAMSDFASLCSRRHPSRRGGCQSALYWCCSDPRLHAAFITCYLTCCLTCCLTRSVGLRIAGAGSGHLGQRPFGAVASHYMTAPYPASHHVTAPYPASHRVTASRRISTIGSTV